MAFLTAFMNLATFSGLAWMKASLAKQCQYNGFCRSLEKTHTDVKDRAEAAASKLGELVDAEHLGIVGGTSLGLEPLLKLNHLDVLETDSSIEFAVDDGPGNVHSAADGSVVGRGHAVVLGKLIDLDLHPSASVLSGTRAIKHLSKLSDVSDALSTQGLEVRSDAAALEVDDTRERLVEEGSDGSDREATGLRGESVDHGFEAHVDLAGADNLGDIWSQSAGLSLANTSSIVPEGSVGSKMATLMSSSVK